MNASATSSISKANKSPHILHWFRRDLRLHDNTALYHTLKNLDENSKINTVSAVFVVTPKQWAEHNMSAVQLDFIFRTLAMLQQDLYQQFKIKLHILQCSDFDKTSIALGDFCQAHGITEVAANIEYEVDEITRDNTVTDTLQGLGIDFNLYHDQCILPPNSITTGDDTMYKVFTPFYNKWQAQLDTSPPQLYEVTDFKQQSMDDNDWLAVQQNELSKLHQQVLADYKLLTTANKEIAQTTDEALSHCQIAYPAGEVEACCRLDQFIADDIWQYDMARDKPALMATSQLSAYLTIGSISPRLCYLQAKKALASQLDSQLENENTHSTDIQRWISELAWRDFYRHVIANRADIVKGNAYKVDTDTKVNWSYNKAEFSKWCKGMTGVPLVDAAMRCLNATGFMHNRLRMVTAMFLTKDLLIDWRWGERYFMQRLIDGDFASNNGGWQWSASVGTDSAPYFRIMNPFSQGKIHDKDALFIKQWLPELKDVPANLFHDENKLRKALSKGGDFAHLDYPLPMVNHKQARLMAIEAFKK